MDKMFLASHRMVVALSLSLVVHLGILSGAKLSSDPTLFVTTSDEIYEASDVFSDFFSAADTLPVEKVQHIARQHISKIEFILISEGVLDTFLGRSRIIAQQVQDEKNRALKKTIPVVKNPSVKPKLITHVPVPYPAEAGGEEGTVVVCFLVGFDGVPEYTSTAESSGNRFIDAAAVETCFRWRFSAARDAKGRLVRCLVYIPVTVKP